MVPGDSRVVIDASKSLVPDNVAASGTRQIEERNNIEVAYTEDNRAVANIQQPAYTGTFPPAGKYQVREIIMPLLIFHLFIEDPQCQRTILMMFHMKRVSHNL